MTMIVPIDLIGNKSSLVQVKAWWYSGTKPLSEPMMTQFTVMSITGTLCAKTDMLSNTIHHIAQNHRIYQIYFLHGKKSSLTHIIDVGSNPASIG